MRGHGGRGKGQTRNKHLLEAPGRDESIEDLSGSAGIFKSQLSSCLREGELSGHHVHSFCTHIDTDTDILRYAAGALRFANHR